MTLDRVVCCYPNFEPLLDAARAHAIQGFALSDPRERSLVKFGVRMDYARAAINALTVDVDVVPDALDDPHAMAIGRRRVLMVEIAMKKATQ